MKINECLPHVIQSHSGFTLKSLTGINVLYSLLKANLTDKRVCQIT